MIDKQIRLDKNFGEGNYTLLSWTNWKEKCKVRCNRHDIEYLTSPTSLINQKISGCPKCKSENLSKATKGRKWNGCTPPSFTTDISHFLKKAKEKHGDNYDYSKVDFVDVDTPVEIICPVHGSFFQSPKNHYRTGCKLCSYEKMRNARLDTEDEFISKSKQLYGDKYDYSKVSYVDSQSHVTITCPTHGDWEIRPYNFLNGHECPRCNVGCKNVVNFFVEFFNDLGFVENEDFTINDRSVIKPKEIDFYFPKLKIGIEHNGLYFHMNKGKYYHLDKKKACERLGVNLIHIWGSDDKTKIKNRLKSVLGKSETSYARKLVIKEVTNKDALEFLNNNHLAGGINSSIRLGLFDDNEMKAIMTFSKPRFDKNHDWELVRYASSGNVVGGASRLLKYFRNKHPGNIITYASRDWSYINKNLYQSLGFKLIKISPPSYIWTNGTKILSRYQTQKHKLSQLLKDFDNSLTEVENLERNNYSKIYDCGNLVYSLTEGQ